MADVTTLLQLLKELPDIVTGLTATKYLTAAGLVVLLYDHLLTFEDEVQLIWGARWGWLKILFFFNRYTVPAYIILCCYVLSGLTTAGLSTKFCQDWIAAVTFLCVTSLGVANIFVIQRVWALWGGSKVILTTCGIALVLTYIATFFATGFAMHTALPDISFSPFIQSCVVAKRQPLYTLGYAIPIFFETFIFCLICWNGLMRPRYARNKLVQQLYFDGIVYFFALTGLRVFNIIVISAAPLEYILLGVFFIWAMITATINRMLITISNNVGIPPASSHTTEYQGTTNQDIENNPGTPPVELKPMRKALPQSPVPTEKTYVVSPTPYSKTASPNPYAKVTFSPCATIQEVPLLEQPSPETTLYTGRSPAGPYLGHSPLSNYPSPGMSSYQVPSPAGPSSWNGQYPRQNPSAGSNSNSHSPYTASSPYTSPHAYASSSSSPNPTSPSGAQYAIIRGPSNRPIPAPQNFMDMRVSMDVDDMVGKGHRPGVGSLSDSERTYF